MKLSRLLPEYEAGLQKFLDFVIEKFGDHGLIPYLCKRCMGGPWVSHQDVKITSLFMVLNLAMNLLGSTW